MNLNHSILVDVSSPLEEVFLAIPNIDWIGWEHGWVGYHVVTNHEVKEDGNLHQLDGYIRRFHRVAWWIPIKLQ